MKRFAISVLLFLIAGAAIDSATGPSIDTTQPATAEPAVSRAVEVPSKVEKVKPVVTDKDILETYQRSVSSDSSGLSNDNYYTNVDGNKVHSPAYSTDGDVPSGASAQCRDGTYSFSQNRRGTCSGHGGVASWL